MGPDIPLSRAHARSSITDQIMRTGRRPRVSPGIPLSTPPPARPPRHWSSLSSLAPATSSGTVSWDSFVDPTTGATTATLVEFELARTRDLFGHGQLDTLTADWLCHHGSARGTTLAQVDGTTTCRRHGDETVTTIARKPRARPRLTAGSLLEANVYKISRAGKTVSPLTENASHGLTLTSQLKADTTLRLPR